MLSHVIGCLDASGALYRNVSLLLMLF